MMMMPMDIIIPACGGQLGDPIGSHHLSIPDMVLLVIHVTMPGLFLLSKHKNQTGDLVQIK